MGSWSFPAGSSGGPTPSASPSAGRPGRPRRLTRSDGCSTGCSGADGDDAPLRFHLAPSRQSTSVAASFSTGWDGSSASASRSPSCVRQDAPGATTSAPGLSSTCSKRTEPIARLIE